MADQHKTVDLMDGKDGGSMNSVTMLVAEQIKGLYPRVEDALVKIMVERELKKRVEALVIVLDKLAVLEKDFLKIRPDQVAVDETGKEVSVTYSKKKFEERKKANEQINKVRGAIEKALIKADYQDVYKLSSGKALEQSEPGSAEAQD